MLDPDPGFDLAQAERLIVERVPAIPRLRQQLVRVPPGCGRPIWVDDSDFDIRRHIRRVPCRDPGDEAALLDTAIGLIVQPLPCRAEYHGRVQISARGEYAVRAALGLAAKHPTTMSAQAVADAQQLPYKFLEAILADLRRAGLVRSQRGVDGGYTLARPPDQVTLGDILRAVDGPLAGVRGVRPEEVAYAGPAEHLQEVWVAVRSAVRRVVDEVTLADVLRGRLPAHVRRLIAVPDAWQPR